MTRVLLLAERTALRKDKVPASGSGAHVLATLSQLESRFEVEAVLAEPVDAQPFPLPRVKRLLPARLRGMRQDLLMLLDDRRFTERALAAAAAFRPDVIYERNEYLAVAGFRVARRLGLPHLLEVNGLLDLDMQTMYRSFGEPLGSYLERWKLRRADQIVTVTPELGRRLVPLGARPDRMTIVPNTVADARMRPQPRTTAPDDAVVIGWVGHLMAWHSLDLLLDAAPAVLADLPRARFRIVGGGEGLEPVKERVRALGLQDAFEFVGHVPFDEVPAIVDTFDIGIIPAHFEFHFAVKLSEMGATGVPVIAPETPSLNEMLEPGVEYAPFRAGDTADFARTVIELGRDPAARERLGGGLYRAVRDRYTWSVAAATLGDAVEATIARHAAGR